MLRYLKNYAEKKSIAHPKIARQTDNRTLDHLRPGLPWFGANRVSVFGSALAASHRHSGTGKFSCFAAGGAVCSGGCGNGQMLQRRNERSLQSGVLVKRSKSNGQWHRCLPMVTVNGNPTPREPDLLRSGDRAQNVIFGSE